ncbi:hypothetical protein GJ496_009781 [Pomphorhynchus laevis]|nr:hypothetical protein GJ496_009781 [Pomphorhynchus laevis]
MTLAVFNDNHPPMNSELHTPTQTTVPRDATIHCHKGVSPPGLYYSLNQSNLDEEDQSQLELTSELNGNITHGEHRFSMERGHYVPKPRVIGRLSYSTIASYMKDSVSIDIKAAAGAISAITAVDFRLAQNLATNMLYGLTVVDNTMLYTKRMDVTAEQFKNDIQTGRFVFTQINVPMQHYPILTHIARAGLTLGPVADQPCLRLSRIAWPAIPVSIYGDQPWVQPDYWNVTANEVRAALIHMASQRHENLDLLMGFTLAYSILRQTGIIINTQVAGAGDGENVDLENGNNSYDLRRPYLQRVAATVRPRKTEVATNRRARGSGSRRPSTMRSRPRATNAARSRPATADNSSETEGNGDSQPPYTPTTDPQVPSTTAGPQTIKYWWLATGELSNIQMYFRPADYNVLWRLITASSRPDFADNMRKELDVLDSANIEGLMNIAWGLASFLSLGCGLALHSNNIYGTMLNDYFQPNPRAGNGLLSIGRFLFESSTDFDKNNLISSSGSFTERVFLDASAVPGIFKIAMAELSNVTPFVVGVGSFAQPAFSARCTGLLMEQDTYWRHRFGNLIPYMVNPLILSFLLHSWPYTWGIYKRDVTTDLVSDIIPHGNVSGLFADQDDTTLSGIAYGDDASVWIYKPYALAIINLICQRFAYENLPQISYREWNRGRATRPGPGAYRVFIFGQTAYVDGLHQSKRIWRSLEFSERFGL